MNVFKIWLQSQNTLPLLTALIGLGGFTVGIFSFVNPIQAAQIYGVPVPLLQRQGQIEFKDKRSQADVNSLSDDLKWHMSYIHSLGIRNFTSGVVILSLTAQWYNTLSRSDASSMDSQVARKCLGTVISVGSAVPLIDAWVCVTGNEGSNSEVDKRVGKRSACLHIARSIVWLVGGLWCYFGTDV